MLQNVTPHNCADYNSLYLNTLAVSKLPAKRSVKLVIKHRTTTLRLTTTTKVTKIRKALTNTKKKGPLNRV